VNSRWRLIFCKYMYMTYREYTPVHVKAILVSLVIIKVIEERHHQPVT